MRLHTCAHLALAVVLAVGCDRPTPLPDLAVSSERLEFVAPPGTADPAPQTLYVTNPGEGALARPELSVSYAGVASGWLSAEVAPGEGAPYRVTVRATVGALPPGTYEASLTVSAANAGRSPVQVPVALVVPGPSFAVDRASLAFDAPRGGADPEPQVVHVSNGGRGTLPVPDVSVSYAGDQGWAAFDVRSSPGGYSLTVRPAVAGVDSGHHAATLSLYAAGVEGPARTIAVDVAVPPPEIALEVQRVDIQAPREARDPSPVSVTITNGGGGNLLRPTASVAPSWWITAEVVGDVPPFALVIAAPQLPGNPGRHEATVTLSSPGAADVILPVALEIPLNTLTAGGFDFRRTLGCGGLLPGPVQQPIWKVGPHPYAERPSVALDDATRGWLEATVGGAQEPWVLNVRLIAEPPAGVHTADLTLHERFSEPSSVAVRVFDAMEGNTFEVERRGVELRVRPGLGEAGPAVVRIRASTNCFEVPPYSIDYQDGPPGWLLVGSRGGHLSQELLLSAAADVVAPGETRSAVLRVQLPGELHPRDIWVSAVGATLSQEPSLALPRSGHTVTSTDYSFLVVGGEESLIAASYPESAGGLHTDARLTVGRSHHGAIAIGNQLFIAGGRTTSGAPTTSAEVSQYRRWRAADCSLVAARVDPSLHAVPNVAKPDRVLVVSGEASPELLVDCATWYADHNHFFTGVPRFTSAVTLADGRVLAAGGTTAEAALFDPAVDSWTATGALGVVRRRPALERLPGGRVLAIGGDDAQLSAEIWDPVTGAWSPAAAPLASHVAGDTVALRNGRVLAFGGWRDAGASLTADIEAYDPVNDAWSVVAVLPSPRRGVRILAPVIDGWSDEVLVTGGILSDGSSTAEVFSW